MLKFYSTRYDEVIIIGDFKIEAKDKAMKKFRELTFYNMMKQNTHFK